MGGTTFSCVGRGTTAREAFDVAQKQARYDHGHSGYTGTIAEKNSFSIVKVPSGFVHDPEKEGWPSGTKVSREQQYAESLLASDTHWINDKWGPAGCLMLKDGSFLFFGWASC
jgi:hypothetical protein